ncbi:uncharacterized protein DS421_2g43980 [Arachis hypogaea]|nr:uncharacterized protein DS421_2g43980 [Arachis hypogaea]
MNCIADIDPKKETVIRHMLKTRRGNLILKKLMAGEENTGRNMRSSNHLAELNLHHKIIVMHMLVGYNSRTCPNKKNHVAAEEDTDAQQAPQAGQPAIGEIVPPNGLQDMSDSEQEMFWEKTIDAVEEELTQGHLHSETDEEANMNISSSTSHGEGRRAAKFSLTRRAPRSTKSAATTPKTPSNTAAAAAASTSRERTKVKMPIMRPPLAQPLPRPTATAPVAQPHARPTALGPPATPRPNPPFRPPQIRSVALATNAAAGLGVPDSTRFPLVSNETMNGASKAITSRFSKFMPNQSC